MPSKDIQAELLRQEKEWRECARDPVYFVSNYCFMWQKEGGEPLDWELWECQEDALRQFEKHRLNIVLKTRQLGMSWTACAYALWKAMFTPNFHVYMQSIGQREVTEQMERIKFQYDNLPSWMHARCEMGGRGRKLNDSLVEFSNGSAIHTVNTTKRAGHGAAPGLYILDEFARNESHVFTWRAVRPALAARGQVIIISTANGIGNTYHQLWVNAIHGKNQLNPIFYPASAHPEYTPEFLARAKDDYAGDEVGYYEAYPSTPEEAFMSSSRCPFDHTRIKEHLDFIAKTGIKPITGRLKYGGKGVEFEADPKGPVLVWRKPKVGQEVDGKIQPKHFYAIGADVAEGLTRGDWSVALVLDADTDEVVAMYRAKIPPEHYAYQLRMLGEYYGNAHLAIEVNQNSDLIMDDLKSSYHNLYCRERRERIYDMPTLEPGFRTTASSKPRIITQLRRRFSSVERPLKIYSPLVLKEMSTFEEDDRGRLGASGENFDDTVMALAIAVEAAETMPKHRPPDIQPKHRRLGSMCL